MKVLVTGANGYIGSRVVKQLLDLDHEVIATDFYDNNIDKRARIFKADLFSIENPMQFFEHPDVCIHLAWADGFIHNSKRHIEQLSSHYVFLTKLIDDKIKGISVMGSMHEVGYYEGMIDEKINTNPMSLYALSKDTLRKALEMYLKDSETYFLWLRGYYILGGDYGNSVFSKIKNASMRGEKEFPFTTGTNKFDFIDVNELSKQIATASVQNLITGVINVCSGVPREMKEVVEEFVNNEKLPIRIVYGAFKERPYDSKKIYGDSTKINEIMQKSKKIIVTGSNGQLGYDILRELKYRGFYNVYGIDYNDLDITDERAVEDYFKKVKPDYVFHNAAYTAVDNAEDDSDKCYQVNVLGSKYLSIHAKKYNAKIMYVSTDYVFDGSKNEPYKINDIKNPLSVYGKTKSEGEDIVRQMNDKFFIVRTSWVFGKNGKNFVKTMLNLAKTKPTLNIVSDQYGSPTYTKDLSKLMVDIMLTDKYGIYHASNEGTCSWYEFANEIFKITNTKINLEAIESNMFPSKAHRPKNSVLDKSELLNNGFKLLPTWQEALIDYLKEIINTGD